MIWTSGGIDKLAVYRGLGVGEVWFWQQEELRFYVLRGRDYEHVEPSELLPAVDPGLLTRFMTSEESQTSAVRALRQALRTGSAAAALLTDRLAGELSYRRPAQSLRRRAI